VTRDDLREVKAFGWLQQGLLTLGTFFFSGAFWLLAELFAHQEAEGITQFTAWMGMCVVSMIFGIALIITAIVFYALKQKRLNKYLVEQ
jgi:cytosine/uracil/thiamine/allantoin permease